MRIRKATIDDCQAIAEVEAKCFPPAEAASEEDIKNRLVVYPDFFWLLEDDGKLISFVDGMATNEMELADEMYSHAAMHDELGDWQMIFGVNTLPEYRKQGCAEKLLKQVIADSQTQGRRGLVLTCKENLVHYYAKFGFQDEGISESTHGGVVWHKMRLTF